MLNRRIENPCRWLAKLLRILMIAGILTQWVGQAAPIALAAGSITVDLTSDPIPIQSACTNAAGDCSLRGAILYANAHPHTEIVLTHGETYTLSIPPAGSDDALSGDLNLTADTTIDFGNQLCMFNCPATVKGITGWSDRIFAVAPGATVQMSGLIITNGNTPNGGGGIVNNGNLIFSAGTISGNATTDYGGGIYNSGVLTITNSTVTNNTAQRDGGGIANYSGTLIMSNTAVTFNNAVATTSWGGGGLFIGNAGNATVADSTFASNTTPRYGGGIYAGGPLTLTNTSVVTNTATQSGGGIYGYSPLSITGGSIMTNTATSYSGGGLYYNNGTVVINGTNISGNHSNQGGAGIYASGASTALSLSGTTINNNHSTLWNGGGVYFDGKSLVVQANSTVNGNTTGSGYGPGIYANGSLTVMDSTVNGNSGGTDSSGGGIYLDTTASTITHSTISNNTLSGGASYGGGLYLESGVLTMTTSTISGNTVSGNPAHGGGVSNHAGSTLVLVASTISNNTAPEGGGLFIAGILTTTNSTLSGNTATTGDGGGINVSSSSPAFSLSNVTITNNQAPNGDGGGFKSSTIFSLKNTIVAGNTAGSVGPDCWGNPISQGYNLVGNSIACPGLTNGVNGDQAGNSVSPLNPYLGALANNGGPTKTHALLASSPAIDAGDPVNCLPTDQRGVARPVYAVCDIGAYEYNGPANPVPHIDSVNPSTKAAGSSGFTLTVNGSNFVANSVVRWNGSNRSTTYVNAGQLTAAITSVDIGSPGADSVTVFDPTPGGGTSNAATLTVTGSTSNHSLYLPLLEK